jgi:hypothetical protein
MKKLENILAENMRRFGTKNLSEQNLDDLENKLGFDSGANRDPKTGNLINPDGDTNNNGYPDGTETNSNQPIDNTFSEKYVIKLHSFIDNKDMLISSDIWQHEIDMQLKSTEESIRDFIKDNPTKVKLVLYNTKAEAIKALGNIKKARSLTRKTDSYSIIKLK